MSEWIKISDGEVPLKSSHEKTHNVLLWMPDSRTPFEVGHGIMSGANGVNYPYTVEGWRLSDGTRIYPTHWMPLPEPPNA